MAYEVRPNSFILFKNYRKNKPNDCDMSGECNLDGEVFHFMNGWCKEDKNGNLMISGSLKPKQAQGERQRPAQSTPPIFRNPTPKPTTPPEQYPEHKMRDKTYKPVAEPKPDDSFDPDDIPF